jgi:hypothetical protein
VSYYGEVFGLGTGELGEMQLGGTQTESEIAQSMSETIISKQIRDTNAYTDTQDSGAKSDTILYHCVNDLDAEVTVTFYGTRQEDADQFNDAEQIGQLTINGGAGDYKTLTDPWEEVQVEIIASTSPTSGEINVYGMY